MRVADMSVQLCNLLGLPEDTTTVIHIAAHLHDIGKIGIEDSILRKPGRLTQKEWQVIHGKVNISAVPKYPKFIHAAVFTAAAFSL